MTSAARLPDPDDGFTSPPPGPQPLRPVRPMPAPPAALPAGDPDGLRSRYLLKRHRKRVRARRSSHASSSMGAAGIVATLSAASAVLTLTVAGGIAAALMFVFAMYQGYNADTVPAHQLFAGMSHGGAKIYDRHGTLLYEFQDEEHGTRRPVPLSQVSRWMIEATIATEDPSFYDNVGLNIRGLARAAYENLAPSDGGEFFEGSGGSSITQQLAKNVYIPQELRAERSVDRKLRETAIAIELTQRYEKDQILEWYLNSISYGGAHVGIEAASQGYFAKPALDLTLAEAALLAGIPQSPAAYHPLLRFDAAKDRQQQVLELMVRHGSITQAEADAAAEEEIVFEERDITMEAPHWVRGPVEREIVERFGDRALREGGLQVVTTLDLELQGDVQEILENAITPYEEQAGGRNGAAYLLDARTGEVLVYLGSRDYHREDIYGKNDNIVALNAPGSTLKPFTYMAAFQKGWGTGTAIIDSPMTLTDPATGDEYEPRNPISAYQGPITVANALGNSLNVTAIKAIQFVGVNETLEMMRNVGFTTLNSPFGYGPALTLGGADITLQDLVIAYSVLANDGVMRGKERPGEVRPGERDIEPVHLLEVRDSAGRVLYRFDRPDERQVVDAEYAYMATSILTDGSTQCITFGACNALSIPGLEAGVKTGTSEPYEGNRNIGETWAVGYTRELVGGVWYGNSDNQPMTPTVYSTSVGWPAFREMMIHAHQYLGRESRPFERPPGVVEEQVCWPSGRLPTQYCPQQRRYTSLYAQQTLDNADRDDLYDTWWRPVSGGQIREGGGGGIVRLVLPREEIEDWSGFWAWARQHGVAGSVHTAGAPQVGREDGDQGGQQAGQPSDAPRPTDVVDRPLALVQSPAHGAVLSGNTPVLGIGRLPSGGGAVLEIGSGVNPTSWTILAQSDHGQQHNLIHGLDTSQLPNGPYVIRVRLVGAGIQHENRVVVTIRN